jgi:hypothetical protein
MAASMGGNVRVGLEDSLWDGPWRLAESNAAQVRRIRTVLDALSLEIASPDAPSQGTGQRGLLALDASDRSRMSETYLLYILRSK